MAVQVRMVRCAVAILTIVALLGAAVAEARDNRSSAARAAFVRMHPCPSTGRPRGACPGYQVDHIIPLACNGVDEVENMQWLTVAEHRTKTRADWPMCIAASVRNAKKAQE